MKKIRLAAWMDKNKEALAQVNEAKIMLNTSLYGPGLDRTCFAACWNIPSWSEEWLETYERQEKVTNAR